MIKIKDKYSQNILKIPKNLITINSEHIIELKSESTNEVYTFTFEDSLNLSDYYTFNYDAEFELLNDGEYIYSIDKGCAIGILILGEYYYKPNLNDDEDKSFPEDTEQIYYYE